MVQIDRIWEFLQRLTPVTRSCLLSELERLELCGVDVPGSTDIQAKLRTEFRKDGSTQGRAPTASRYFFEPLDPLLADGDHENAGRIARGSLAPIWEWVTRDLLPTMARDFEAKMRDLITNPDKQKEARAVAATFQIKVAKSLENTLRSPDTAEQARAKLANYTAARSTFAEVEKMMRALRARDALAKFDAALPVQIAKFDDSLVTKMTALLAAFGKNHPDAIPFAIALIGRRLKAPWQLIRLATKAAASKSAADVAKTPYAVAVGMVLDRLDDKRLALRIALKNNRVLIARDLLSEIYDIEYQLQVRIDQIEDSDWGKRLRTVMEAIETLVEAEVSRFPPDVGHVLGSRSLRGHDSLAGRLTYLAWKGRDAVSNGAAFCKKLINAA
jgi:hypothetical protein